MELSELFAKLEPLTLEHAQLFPINTMNTVYRTAIYLGLGKAPKK